LSSRYTIKVFMDDLVQSMRCDPSLKTTQEEVESWINEISAKDYHYLEGKNFSIVDSEKENALRDYDEDTRRKWLESLKEYRLVYTIQEIRPGQHTRWISWSKTKARLETDPIYGNHLHNGASMRGVKFTDKEVYCTVNYSRSRQQFGMVKFNQTIMFQKLTPEEQMVLLSGGG